MRTLSLQKFLTLSFLSLALVAVASLALSVSAQSDTASSSPTISQTGIVFPIAELGSCTDKTSCRAYCDAPEHMDACIVFARSHGLATGNEAERAQTFAKELSKNGGPGKCKTPSECKLYCDNVTHADECIAFAKQHGLNDESTSQAEKISAYVKTGGTMPGGCATKVACQAYCSDLTRLQECQVFAQNVGLAQSAGKNPIPPGQFQKFTELVKNGETPGQCTTTDGCKVYCQNPAHRDECVTFAQKAGLVPQNQASTTLEAFGGVGLGKCDSANSCRVYCNDPAHRDECYKFAGEHGLISKDQLKNAQDISVRLKEGLSQAPPEVVACIKSTVGEQVLAGIQADAITPGSEIGTQVKSCFEKFGHKIDMTEELKRVPPHVLSCLQAKLGDQVAPLQNGTAHMSPDVADAVRGCAQTAKPMTDPAITPGPSATSTLNIGEYIRNAPPAVQTCIREKLGGNLNQVLSGQTMTDDVKSVLRACSQAPRPGTPTPVPSPSAGNGSYGSSTKPTTEPRPQVPPVLLDCLKLHLSLESLQQFMNGVRPQGDDLQIITKCYTQFRSTQSTSGTNVQGETAVPPSGSTPGIQAPPPPTTAPTSPSSKGSSRLANIWSAFIGIFFRR